MAKYFNSENLNIQNTDVMTGDEDVDRYLYYQLKMSFEKAHKIDIITSFLMESGVRMLLNDFKQALERGAQIRILTGNYLGITEPSALYLIKQHLGDKIDLRFYDDNNRSFHPKSYFFFYTNYAEIYIGSSNLSKSALTSGIEWNYRFTNTTDKINFELFYATFEDLFDNHSIIITNEVLKKYSKEWKKPAISKDLNKYDEIVNEPPVTSIFQPHGPQIEALYALHLNRNEGATRALIHAATGIGKTYLAAFDSVDYDRVLFIAHREEILTQAANSFHNVRPEDSIGFFNGEQKDTSQMLIFASVQTLGSEKYLNDKYFDKEAFDYIVIDECHHSVTDQYQRIVNYFHPKFLLGLTATPERMDGRDVYEICHYNVPYELSLRDAVNKGVLVPFHYYGIYDDTDYSSLHFVRGHYDEKELNETYIGNTRRYDLIFKHYSKYRSKRAIGFCCSKQHASDMAREFSSRGVKCCAVHSGVLDSFSMARDDAIKALKKLEINVIFCVDMFNEGVDVPELDMVLFLRPTESTVIFLQQLGRGLRKSIGKSYLNVLDFIGNYRTASLAPVLLSGNAQSSETAHSNYETNDYPDDCFVDFDMRILDLFREMEHREQTIHERILSEYKRIRLQIERVPTRVELHSMMNDAVYRLCLRESKENIFKHYLKFLNDVGDLSNDLKNLFQSEIAGSFISLIENTNMTRSYKMPVLYAFYNNGNIRTSLTIDELLKQWKDFFNVDSNWKDLPRITSYQEFRSMTDKQHIACILKNPVHFLIKSSNGLFIKTDTAPIAICDEAAQVIKMPEFANQIHDILDYRTMHYYRMKYLNKNDE